MSFLDKLKKTATEHKKEIEGGLDKAEALAHDKLPDKFDDKIDMAADKAKDAVEKLD
jgi:MT0933-like antitoxin protein